MIECLRGKELMLPRKLLVCAKGLRELGSANLEALAQQISCSEAQQHELICFVVIKKNGKLLNFPFDNFVGSGGQGGIYFDFKDARISADKIHTKWIILYNLFCVSRNYLPVSEPDML